MLNRALTNRLHEFLPTVRVGIDFGEGAGGIAVVQRNAILHAETYVDFHETTLEKRRQLRRGRRTRHSKQMRLARLRSWILRQKFPDGTRLPDPYVVMRNPRFHAQPGVFEKPGVNPLRAPSWIDLVRQGGGDAEAFVKVLTLIFQKRGYKWDSIALKEMTDFKLKDFLTTARIPNDILFADVLAQIERREDDPDHPVRGKSKVPTNELLDLLEKARRRQPQPRQAEHRSVKAAELSEVVAGFGKSAEVPAATLGRWHRELCGVNLVNGREIPGLLNRILRPARFENRLRTGCAWCGKPTPRKTKVRHIAYAAAVCNLRIREGRRVRPLSEREMELFWDWWRLQEAASKCTPAPAFYQEAAAESGEKKAKEAPKLGGIEGHLRRLGAQVKMGRQLFDLLWNDQPKGRASLCKQHLEQAALGKTMKDAGVEWQAISVRKAANPCREQHDMRVLRRLEQILFKPGESGEKAWRYGPVQFITVEVPTPLTEQARKGEMKPRKVESFMERLGKETGGLCIYCDGSSPRPAVDKDHVFPQSRGGPDVWDNLVPACKACNTDKGNRTPFEWLRDLGRWERFTARVNRLADKGIPVAAEQGEGGSKKAAPAHFIRIGERKRALLLGAESEYPENPTPLAHVGARPRQFVVELSGLFRSRGVKAPRIDYQLGEPLVQRIDGRTTSQLRKSWLKKADEATDNFPPKNRWDLANHAQDAALIAACPPHTWRDTIFCRRAVRPKFEGEAKTVWAEQDGLAANEVAPDWVDYMERRTWPLVRVLGRYPVGWKRTFADQNFYQNPEKLDDKRLRQNVPLANLAYKGLKPGKKPSAARTKMVREDWDSSFNALGESLVEEWNDWKKAHTNPSKDDRLQARSVGLTPERTIPRERLDETEQFRGVRHVKVEKQPGGRLARVAPEDGPARKVQLKKASEAAVIWHEKGKSLDKLQLSVRWPVIFQKFGVPRHDPELSPGAVILAVWPRYKSIWLDEETGHEPGFYRVKEFTRSEITVLPENAVTDELARRLSLKKAKTLPTAQTGDGDSESEEKPAEASGLLREIKLYRKDLVRFFEALKAAG